MDETTKRKVVNRLNIGLTKDILELLDRRTDVWFKDMYKELRQKHPGLVANQLSATLSSLKRYGKVLHLCRNGWASVEYPNR